MKVAVIGAGIMGSNAARFLAKDGHEVHLFEQFNPATPRGSSHGRSRIVRVAYEDPQYSEWMLEGYFLWDEIEAEADLKLIHRVGLTYIHPTEQTGRKMLEELLEVGDKVHLIPASEIPKHITLMKESVGACAVYSPYGGWVSADDATVVTARLARGNGAVFRREKVSREQIEMEFDSFVVCAGPWASEWLELPLTVTRQVVAYITGSPGGSVWICHSDRPAYGFPSEDGKTFKMAFHLAVEPWDPGIDPQSAPPIQTEVDDILAFAKMSFDIEHMEVVETVNCLYTNTPNEDFLFAKIGDKGFLASPCSGHGFKFGPWIGKRLANFVAGREKPEDYPRLFFKA